VERNEATSASRLLASSETRLLEIPPFPEPLPQAVDSSRRDAAYVALGNDAGKRPFCPLSLLKEPIWVVGALSELGDS